MKKKLTPLLLLVTLVFSVLIICTVVRENNRSVMTFARFDGSDREIYKININTADEDELASLPGIGEGLAKEIVSHRSRKPFEKVSDLRYIVSDNVYEEIKDLIKV